MRPSARSRNMVSITVMQAGIERSDFIFSLFIYSGSINYLWSMKVIYCYFFILSVSIVSCVSTGTYKALQGQKAKSDSLYTWAMTTLKASQVDNARLSREKAALRDSVNEVTLEMAAVKQNNTMLHKQLVDLSAISTS